MKRFAIALLAAVTSCSCFVARRPAAGPAEAAGGTLVVYLLPLPREAGRLILHLGNLSAVREDGAAVPLPLLFTDVRGDAPASEKRLAATTLPPGRYTGLLLTISEAALAGTDGAAALLPPREPVPIPVPFRVEMRRGVVLALRLAEGSPVESGFRFAPAFLAEVPPRAAPGLIGVVTSRRSNAVTLFDKVSGRVVGVLPAGRMPGGLAVDPAGNRAYVAASGDDTIEEIGLLEQDVLRKLVLRGGDEPAELALTPDGRSLLSANVGSSTVSLIDAVSLVETARIAVGNGPGSVLVDRAGQRAYAFNAGSSTITVVDIAARGVAGTIATEAGPLRGQFNRAGDRLYVIHRSSPYLTVIDPLALGITERVYVGPGAVALKVDPQTDRIYLARRGASAIDVYDPQSFLPVDTIRTDGDVSFMTIDDEGNTLYVVLNEAGQVHLIRIVGKEITVRVDVGDEPSRVALVGER